MKMITRGKMAILPSITRRLKKVKPVENAEEKVAYYPGCSLHSTGVEYDISTTSICKSLGMDLVEIEDWVCCGSTAAHKSDPDEALQLPMENLRIVEQAGYTEVTMPCASCFNRHKSAQYEVRNHEEMAKQVDQALGYNYELEKKSKRSLEGLKAVAYYGCLLTRPPQVTEAKNPENPVEMDKILEALGVEVMDWSYKTCCCGASHSVSRPDIVLDLSSALIEHAKEAGAEVIAVACPLCHANLDARQLQMDIEDPIPVLYFTQLMGVAMGLPEKETAINKNMIDPRPLLKEKKII
jgi:heterodisulfide reductase subunit B